MAFKTAAEMFGDGGGFGPAVPYSTSNPPGTSAGNRGIQFGEQLTAAIANRTHYALALNDQDLNTRLASFETGGLDGAYHNGTIGPAGGGRDIVKNGGAVETSSSLASQYADDIANAHFRANAMGDTSPGGGFDWKGSKETADPIYGFMARENTVAAQTNSNIGFLEVGTLNPGGIGTDLLRFTSGTAYTGPDTDVALGLDMVEISGAATGINGLYRILSFGPTTADFHLRRLDGSAPTFSSGTAVSIRPFRATLMSPANISAGSFGAAVSALQGDEAALGLFAHDFGWLGTGSDKSIEWHALAPTGADLIPAYMTATAQLRSTVSSAMFYAHADDEMRMSGGIHNLLFDHSGASAGSHEVGMVFKDVLDAATSRAAAENWQRITETTVFGVGPSVNGTFAAPAGRILLPDSDGTPAAPTGQLKWSWSLLVTPGVTVIEMLSGSNQGQFFLLNRVTLTGTSPSDPVADEIRVTDMDGNTPTLPTSTDFTFRFLSRDVFGYKMPASQLKSSPDTGVTTADPVAYAHIFGTQRSTAVQNRSALFLGGGIAGGQIDDTNASGDHYLEEKWVVRPDGNIYTVGQVRAAGATLTTDTQVVIPQTDVTINLDLSTAMSEEDATGTPLWRYDRTNQRWELITLGGGSDSALYIPIPFSGILRFTTVQAFAGSGSSHSVFAALRITTPAWGTPATPPTVVNANEATIVFANGAWGENFITHGGGGANLFWATNSYAIRIRGQRVGDLLQAVKCTVRYTGLAAGGMGG